MKVKKLKLERDLMARGMKTSLKLEVQLRKSIQVVVVILMGMGDQIKIGNHPEGRKNYQMDLEK